MDRAPILFVRTGALGDFCLTAPVLAAAYATGRRVEVMCEPRFAPIVDHVAGTVPNAVRGRLWDGAGTESLWLYGGSGSAPPFGLGVAFSASHREALVALGIPEIRAVASRPPAGVRAADHFRSAWPGCGAPELQPDRARSATIVIAPGSAGIEKVWPLARWREVDEGFRALGFHVRWLGGPLEPWATDRPALPELMAIAADCHAWLGADSGTSHLAALMGARVGVVARPESPPWVPDGAMAFDWEVDPNVIVAAFRARRLPGAGSTPSRP